MGPHTVRSSDVNGHACCACYAWIRSQDTVHTPQMYGVHLSGVSYRRSRLIWALRALVGHMNAHEWEHTNGDVLYCTCLAANLLRQTLFFSPCSKPHGRGTASNLARIDILITWYSTHYIHVHDFRWAAELSMLQFSWLA